LEGQGMPLPVVVTEKWAVMKAKFF
jgi:hypothetical protein